METFIEGKIEVNNRKSKELLELMTREKLKLEEQIEEQRCQIASEQEKVTQLQMALKADDDIIEVLKSSILELEEACEECKEESKRCRFFRCEQDDLENFLVNESKKRGLGRCTTTSTGKRKISSRN